MQPYGGLSRKCEWRKGQQKGAELYGRAVYVKGLSRRAGPRDPGGIEHLWCRPRSIQIITLCLLQQGSSMPNFYSALICGTPTSISISEGRSQVLQSNFTVEDAAIKHLLATGGERIIFEALQTYRSTPNGTSLRKSPELP
jgi:hypothetical protein